MKNYNLAQIKLITIMKVSNFNWFSHSECANPYIQIYIGGLVLDGTGEPVPADIEDSVEFGNYGRLSELMDIYVPGSLHLLESNKFWIMDRHIIFYDYHTRSLDVQDVEEINHYF